MKFFDIIFGRTKPPKAKLDPLFALTTASITFEVELGWIPTGRAGLVLRPATGQDFQETEKELEELLNLAIQETKTRMKIQEDEYRYRWIIFEDPDWDDLVSLIHLTGQTLAEKGYDTQLLAAVFSFRKEEDSFQKSFSNNKKTLFLIFNYKRGTFYPFIPEKNVPHQEDGGRDNAEEMHIFALLEKELPWEKNVGYWYPLWGCPV